MPRDSRMSFKALLSLPQLLMCLLLCNLAQAQPLPPPSRTVFKCDEGGRVVYSDRPCLGAKKIEVEPTRGVSRLSGRERVGSDVQREVFRENVAEALRPATDMNPRPRSAAGAGGPAGMPETGRADPPARAGRGAGQWPGFCRGPAAPLQSAQPFPRVGVLRLAVPGRAGKKVAFRRTS